MQLPVNPETKLIPRLREVIFCDFKDWGMNIPFLLITSIQVSVQRIGLAWAVACG